MGVRVEGLDDLVADLRESADRALEPQPALELWAASLERLVEEAFARQASPEGEAWAPRRMTTRSRPGAPERPRRREPGRRLGRLTGEMMASVEVVVAPRAVVLEVGAEHAHFFAGGTRHQPARSFVPTGDVGASADLFDELGEGLADHITEPMRG